MEIAGSQVSLLAHPPNPAQNEGMIELSFESSVGLEQIEQDLRDAGLEPDGPISEQGFGRQLLLSSPDGLLLKINQVSDNL